MKRAANTVHFNVQPTHFKGQPKQLNKQSIQFNGQLKQLKTNSPYNLTESPNTNIKVDIPAIIFGEYFSCKIIKQ